MRLDQMNLEQLQEAKRKHYENPNYFLKFFKPPHYHTKMALLDHRINNYVNNKI
ncbi:hypothetical protein [Psychroserpens burtonensis]|uniref:hypothetical protein n=1 Tax=Psychroserpens burtonensis TaxID=49278 RepID=UPI00164A70BC|nr:hypothetical protein [Psychroserpens burtonensis]